MSAQKALVYIVEDAPSFRKSTERLLRASGFETVSFDSANAFLALPHIRRPACLLLDVRLPDIDGLDLQQELVKRGNRLPIVFMTGHGNIPLSVRAMKQGAEDFLPKPFKAEVLQNAILRALERDTQNVEKEIEAARAKSLIETLTPREKEVLRWVIAGKPNKQIAFALGTTEKTIKVHRSRVMQKTKVSSVAELVRLAEQAGISPAV
ncbi:MAG TPA: response regulator [Candidatus Hydrogenedentes bacterium]|nr:response regulator [Candidatus Hydrogenedentota bacterium]HQE82767.1 response regulator [Candidatus Hydrogenedentota bacterium]HQH51549.1 response regulator [Candidatus Hydrogenedentota bacterium]